MSASDDVPSQRRDGARPEDHLAGDVLTVSQVTARIKHSLEGFGRLAVEGEISGLKRAGSGHVYFSLKDLDAVISCALWRSRALSAAPFELTEGMHVVCHGKLDVYRPRGTYNLIVERIEQRGIGEMLARLEELKRRLKERGWFERARPLPQLPRTVGLVTSRSGAALQDFLRTRSRRWPLYPVRLAHSTVQGPGAAAEIAEAIERLAASGVDLIVLARGGGSLEDLWAFNELPVAEAIWRCPVPLVSAVGHETDFTLADMVADQRAHTPTDGAQRVIPERAVFLESLDRIGGQLEDGLRSQIRERERSLAHLAGSRVLREPGWVLGDRARALDDGARRLGLAAEALLARKGERLSRCRMDLAGSSPALQLERRAARLGSLRPRLQAAAVTVLARRGGPLTAVGRALEATSPFAVLARGYSITRAVGEDGDGAPLTEAAGVGVGALLETVLHRGRLTSRVEAVADAQGSVAPDATGGEEDA